MVFRPLHARVLVRRIKNEEKTSGDIIIPDTAEEKPVQGEVIAKGPGARNDSGEVFPLDINVGDLVLFEWWAGLELEIDGEDLLVIKEGDIMGIVESSSKIAAAAA